MQNLIVCLVQTDIFWEQKEKNLKAYAEKLSEQETPSDLIVLPEMFATGFTMNPDCAEESQGKVLQWMQEMAGKYQCAVTGSIMVRENGAFFNRLYWVEANGTFCHYDKKHLFRFGNEHRHYTPGNEKLIVNLKGWKVRPLVCYDLRFPVWSRNTFVNGQFDYDCLLYVANWPERRSQHWKSLIVARAIENLSFCIGVNRVGKDGNDLPHSGNSMVCDPLGNVLHTLEDHRQGLITATLKSKTLLDWREKFNTGPDWDHFELQA